MSVNSRASLFYDVQDKTGIITSKNNTNYTYDNIGRLTKAGAESFSYDKAGNNLNDNAVYNILNNRLNASDIYTITYDSMGNIKSKYNKLTNTTSNYTFNSRNQLVSYEQLDDANQTTKTLTYTYDAFNRRVSKTEDGVEQKYLYDGDDIVAILDSSNAVIATITHDESIDTPLSITNANGTFYYHRDHQGSIIALTDENGQVVESFTYDNHYGAIISHTKSVETNNPYGYTGREVDTPELYYYRARYYDPQIQRFLGEDPIGFASGDFNWYRYVGDNPVNRIDPTGTKSFSECLAKCSADQLGLSDALALGAGISGLPLIKKPFGGGESGATKGTSPLSMAAGHDKNPLKDTKMPKNPFRGGGSRQWPAPTWKNWGARTSKLGRFFTRWIPGVGWGLLAYDGIQIGICTKKCMENSCE